jgi:DNA modification methylase
MTERPRKYPDDFIDKVICGDCLELLKEIPDQSVDLVVTDPPYGISFMGKSWDRALPSLGVWRECFRVLRHGGFAFVMCIPRQDCLSRMIVLLEDAGFDVGFSPIFWGFASGFPKAMNVSKAVDKRLGAEREVVGKREDFVKRRNKNSKKFSNSPYMFTDNDIQPELSGIITTPATHEAKLLDGSYAGFQPKPAVEIVIVAMKPLSEKTYINQALKDRKGITWLDDCQIPSKTPLKSSGEISNAWREKEGRKDRQEAHPTARSGRFPANLLVSDDVLNDGRVTKSSASLRNMEESHTNTYGWTNGGIYKSGEHFDDSGSFSRYFSLDAWWENKVKSLPKEVQEVFPFLLVPKASKSEKNRGCENLEKEIGHNRFDQCETCGGYILQNPKRHSACKCDNPIRKNNKIKGNSHPTVKPIQLGCYLIELGSRQGDIILDPFSGSGSFLISAYHTGRHFIGTEIEKESHEIAEARLNYHMRQRKIWECLPKTTLTEVSE